MMRPGTARSSIRTAARRRPWDAAEWQLRGLAAPLTPRDLVWPVLQPKHIYLADHPSWHNARPDRRTPFVSALYRYGGKASTWRAWDDEIIAVQTDTAPGASATVWRLAHHRTDVTNDNDPSRINLLVHAAAERVAGRPMGALHVELGEDARARSARRAWRRVPAGCVPIESTVGRSQVIISAEAFPYSVGSGCDTRSRGERLRVPGTALA